MGVDVGSDVDLDMGVDVKLRARAPGAASAAVTVLGRHRVVLLRVDPSERRGALDPSASETVTRAACVAYEERLPLVAMIASSGADVTHGVASLHGWGMAARAVARCSGVVPLLTAVIGATVSGPALLLGLADVVVMTDTAFAYMSGTEMVAEFTGQRLSPQTLGGAVVHGRHTGVAAAVVPDEPAALALLGHVLSFLPSHTDELPPSVPPADPADRSTPEVARVVPASPSGTYDVRSIIRPIVDGHELLELWAAWAPNLVTGLARVAGRTVGIVANQPLALAGTLDIAASQKGARFVELCDAFNVPLLTLVDTSGFFPGKTLEWRGMIRHGAQLVGAYARATVPRICLVVRKAYGGAFIVMDSKTMGNDLCLAWPTAELAVMGARGAVQILHRQVDEDRRGRLEAQYEEAFLTPYAAAERGYVDAVIDPADTRHEIAAALDLLEGKRELLAPRAHDTLPL